MAQNINLIPAQELDYQTRTKAVKMSTILTVLLFVIISGVAAFYYFALDTVKENIVQKEASVTSLRADIQGLADIEINSRNLYAKSVALMDIFNNGFLYSKMLSEIDLSTPESIIVDNFNIGKDGSINLSGTGDAYNSIQEFTNNLLERELFTQVSLNTVGLEGRSGKVNYFIIVSFDKVLLND